ncbi:hypothetical protein BOTNAR_0113g00120 [Botryotinia narcissicola]|uniref:Uncharacterized protein n=1 Tax=Botryotinia narcissicola TaxID=278944 RepID=A0A4Z1ILB5_9HELO|nr:hypothetical protein BOTNAR_0113g00120 [Botryotinia narcissicola]
MPNRPSGDETKLSHPLIEQTKARAKQDRDPRLSGNANDWKTRLDKMIQLLQEPFVLNIVVLYFEDVAS